MEKILTSIVTGRGEILKQLGVGKATLSEKSLGPLQKS